MLFSKEISNPFSQNVVLSGENSSSQLVLPSMGMDVKFQISYPRNPTYFIENLQSKMVVKI